MILIYSVRYKIQGSLTEMVPLRRYIFKNIEKNIAEFDSQRNFFTYDKYNSWLNLSLKVTIFVHLGNVNVMISYSSLKMLNHKINQKFQNHY